MSVSWFEIMEHCSRLHTTRRRPCGPWEGAELREDSQVLNVTIRGRLARIVPTRMHEPGFYVSYADEVGPARNDEAITALRDAADDGEMLSAEARRRDTNKRGPA
jgi:hypothetical protein